MCDVLLKNCQLQQLQLTNCKVRIYGQTLLKLSSVLPSKKEKKSFHDIRNLGFLHMCKVPLGPYS